MFWSINAQGQGPLSELRVVNQNPDWVDSERFYVEVFLNPSSGPEILSVLDLHNIPFSVFFFVAPVLIVSQ
jgi:hypothetical protein